LSRGEKEEGFRKKENYEPLCRELRYGNTPQREERKKRNFKAET